MADDVDLQPPLKWRGKFMYTPNMSVPTRPGLYAIGHTDVHVHGLEIQRTYAYIGEAENLKRRLEQHLLPNEQNPDLRKYLLDTKERVRWWYTTTDSLSRNERLAYEQTLIRRIKPACNRKDNPDR